MQQYCSANNNGLLRSNGPYKSGSSGLLKAGVQMPVVRNGAAPVLHGTTNIYQTASPSPKNDAPKVWKLLKKTPPK